MLEGISKKKLKKHIRIHNTLENVRHKLNDFIGVEFDLQNLSFMNSLPNINETQIIMKHFLKTNLPTLSLRFGLYEYQLCYQYLEKVIGLRKHYTDFIKYHIALDAGIMGDNEVSLDKYCEYIISNLNLVDIMSYWRNVPDIKIFNSFYSQHISHINVEKIYPYPFWHKNVLPDWQIELKNKKVIIISSFAETIRNQYKKRRKIWKNADIILPEMDLICYKSVVTNGGCVDNRFVDWQDAVNYMVDNIIKNDFDIALISAGGYGMPLAISLRKAGYKALQWGGCYQLWFGIMGGRWINDKNIKSFMNEYWVFPTESETPPRANEVNGSSYWRPR